MKTTVNITKSSPSEGYSYSEYLTRLCVAESLTTLVYDFIFRLMSWPKSERSTFLIQILILRKCARPPQLLRVCVSGYRPWRYTTESLRYGLILDVLQTKMEHIDPSLLKSKLYNEPRVRNNATWLLRSSETLISFCQSCSCADTNNLLI